MTPAILTRGKHKNLLKCLDSVKQYDFVLGNCGEYFSGCKNIKWNNSYSEAKNDLIKDINGWCLVLEPWERLIDCCEMPQEDGYYRVNLLENGWLSKPIRLFNKKIKFSNPIYEFIDEKTDKVVDIWIISEGGRDIDFELFNKWKKEDNNKDIIYYEAFNELSIGNVNKFESKIKEYIFYVNEGDSVELAYLYLGLILSKTKPNEALGYLARVLIKRPWAAEAWVAASEIFRLQGHIERSKWLYKAAIEFGKERPLSDLIPMDISKYKEDPERMLNLLSKELVK